jgi:murein DD-endopeptidase MepM/ murein hydrolase activator NlpD
VNRQLALLALVAGLLLPLATPAVAGNLDDDLAEVRSRISALKSEASEFSTRRSPILTEALAAQKLLDDAELEVANTTARYDETAAKLAATEAQLAETRNELSRRFAHLSVLREELDSTREDAKAWVVEAYKRGGMAEPAIALAAGRVADISVGVAYLEILTGMTSDAADRFQVVVDEEAVEEAKVKAVEADLVVQADAIERTTTELAATLASLDARRADLASKAAEQATRLAQIDAEIDEFDNEIAALAREEASIKAAISAASSPKPSTGSGKLMRPVPGAVSSGFGKRIHPITGGVKMHNGVDMNALMGEPISAAASGNVILAGVKGGYGNTVMIDHGGGMVTLYAHQSKLGVSVGQSVSRGQTIGWVGTTGNSTGPHLHFEVRINGVPRNPVEYW